MSRPINSGKRVESIDRVGRFSVELSRFVRLDRFQGLGPWRVSMDELMEKNLPYFVGGNLATLVGPSLWRADTLDVRAFENA